MNAVVKMLLAMFLCLAGSVLFAHTDSSRFLSIPAFMIAGALAWNAGESR